MTCGIIGDSIALGLALAMPQCDSQAVIGAPSSTIREWRLPKCYDVAVISAGSNDPRNPDLARNLRAIRGRICASKVIWILPANAAARAAVTREAGADPTISFRAARDGVHPRSYSALARAVGKVSP